MAYGFTSPMTNNRKASAFFGSPYSNVPYTAIVYRTPQTQATTAFVLLQNGNSQSSRISKFDLRKSLIRQIQNSYY
jgi:hypothetical protein